MVDWDRLKRCLAALHESSPAFLSRGILIGGAACWFYRALLRKASDPDFPVPPFRPDEEQQWLSKDIDFTGIFSVDARELLPDSIVTDKNGNVHLQIEGIRLGFAQTGIVLDPESARENCRVGRFQITPEKSVEFFVIDPVTLYREKTALRERRNGWNDRLHLQLLTEFVGWDVCEHARRLLSANGLAETQLCLKFLRLAEKGALEIFQLPKVRHRLEALLTTHANAGSEDVALLRRLIEVG